MNIEKKSEGWAKYISRKPITVLTHYKINVKDLTEYSIGLCTEKAMGNDKLWSHSHHTHLVVHKNSYNVHNNR